MSLPKFMDKQIMGLSGARAQGGDLLGLLNTAEGHQSNGAGAGLREEILPSYDFQPIRRPSSPPPPPPPVGHDGGGAWGSTDSKSSSSNFRNYGSLEAHESSKVIHERRTDMYDTANMAEIDCTVKKYADILLQTLEGVSLRLSQLEGRTYNLETVVDDLKLSIGNSSGSTDGKLRQLENFLREVQTGVQVICDKQEIAEAQMQLAKLQVSEGDSQPPDSSSTLPSEPQKAPKPLPQQPFQQPAQTSAAPPPLQLPALSAPPVPNPPVPPPPTQQNPPHVQFSTQIPQPHVSTISSMPLREPYLPPPGQPPADAAQQYYQPPPQQTQLPPPQPYQSAPQLAQYSQPPQPPPQPVAPSQLQPSLPHHPEELSPYIAPSQTYPPSMHQPPHLQTGPPPPQQIYGSAANVYEPPASRPASVQLHFPTGYGPPSGPSFSDSFTYGGSPSPYSSAREPSPFSSSPAPSSGSTYPRLPTAQVLPQAQPTGSNSGGSPGNRVPLDDVVDKVTTMGFPRDLVRATVRKLTENGQAVDLNTVLDKLMNGSESQPLKGWFGR